MMESLTGAEVRKLMRGDHVPRKAAGTMATSYASLPPFKGRATRYGARHVPGVMNKSETAYSTVLAARQASGEVLCWWFETVTLRLANRCRFTPDFAVFFPDGSLEFVDVKGPCVDEKSRVKIKLAAQLFPQFGFVMEHRIPVKQGGGWRREEF